MTTHTARILASNETDALARFNQYAERAGVTATGRTATHDAYHGVYVVEFTTSDDSRKGRDHAWFMLTSYGISPAKGFSGFGDRMDAMADAL